MKVSKKLLEKKNLKDITLQFEESNDRYFIISKDTTTLDTVLKLFKHDICSFNEIVDEFKQVDDEGSYLHKLFKNDEFFNYAIENNKLTKADLRYFLKSLDWVGAYNVYDGHPLLLSYIVDNDLFQELVDAFKEAEDNNPDHRRSSCLPLLLEDLSNVVESLINNNKLNTEDLRYLLDSIDEYDELSDLCYNTSLIKHILNEFVLNKDFLVDKFNTIIEKIEFDDEYWSDWFEERNIHNIFDWIEYETNNSEEVLKLSELNRIIYNFDLNEEQTDELIEVLKDNEIAQNRLKETIDNNLESNYDFESLMNYLKKDEKNRIKNFK